MATLLAFDNDGVFNVFSKGAKNLTKKQLERWVVSYREDVMVRVRSLLSRDDVQGAWLSTWLMDPALLAQLEEFLGLQGLMEHKALYPTYTDDFGDTVTLPEFAGRASDRAYLPTWWKFRAWELLLDDVKPERAAWIDDDLGRAQGKGASLYRPHVTPTRFLYRTHAVAGLLHEDMDKLEAWVGAPAVNTA